MVVGTFYYCILGCYCLCFLTFTHTTHSYTIHFIISLSIEIKISHRPTQKCMWVAWIMDMRLELPLNSSFVKWRSTANLNTHYTYTALCWCGRSFIRSVWLSLLWVAADRLTHSNKVRFVQPRGLCGRVRLMRLDKPSTLTWDLGERCLGLMCNALDAAGLRVLRLRPVKPVFRYNIC